MQASEFLKLFVLPFKVPQLTMFPSVACSSYFGYFVQFSRCASGFCRNQIQTLSLPKCLNPFSKVHFWDPSMMGRGRSRAQAFWHRQNLAAGGIHFRRGRKHPQRKTHRAGLEFIHTGAVFAVWGLFGRQRKGRKTTEIIFVDIEQMV